MLTQVEQEINIAREKLAEVKQKVDRIIRNGQSVNQLENCQVEIEKIHYPIYQMCQDAKLNPAITVSVLQVNDEIIKYKNELQLKKAEIGQKKPQIREQNIQNPMLSNNFDQNEEIRLVKQQNQQMQAEIKALKENQEMQNILQQQLFKQVELVISQNQILQNKIQQQNDQLIENKNIIQEKNQRIIQVENSIKQMQQEYQNINVIRLSDSQLQNSQIIRLLQNQVQECNNQLNKLSQYISIQLPSSEKSIIF